MKTQLQRKPTAAFMSRAALVAVSFTAAACASRAAPIESEPAPLTEEAYDGAYDLYLGGMEITEGQAAPLTAEWTDTGFVASRPTGPGSCVASQQASN